jgi:hypothetical protein
VVLKRLSSIFSDCFARMALEPLIVYLNDALLMAAQAVTLIPFNVIPLTTKDSIQAD